MSLRDAMGQLQSIPTVESHVTEPLVQAPGGEEGSSRQPPELVETYQLPTLGAPASSEACRMKSLCSQNMTSCT